MEFVGRIRLLKMEKNFTIFFITTASWFFSSLFPLPGFHKRVREVPSTEGKSVGRMQEYASILGRASLRLNIIKSNFPGQETRKTIWGQNHN